MNEFLSSLLSKKLAFAAAAEVLVQSLHTTAETKSLCTALVAMAFLIGQAYVDAHQPKPSSDAPAPPAAKE